jgi:hypothetical protein
MDNHLTNGSRSIPRLIAHDVFGTELFTWGPRPVHAQSLLLSWKQRPQGRSWEDFEKELHTWYAKDKTLSIQKEFTDILSIALKGNSARQLSY